MSNLISFDDEILPKAPPAGVDLWESIESAVPGSAGPLHPCALRPNTHSSMALYVYETPDHLVSDSAGTENIFLPDPFAQQIESSALFALHSGYASYSVSQKQMERALKRRHSNI